MSRPSTFSYLFLAFWFVVALGLAGVACTPQSPTFPTPLPPPTPDPANPPQRTFLGVNYLNSPLLCANAVDLRCYSNENARELGISGDRWAVEWYWVEQPGRDGRQRDHFEWEGDFPKDPHDEFFDVEEAAIADNASGEQLYSLVNLHGIPRPYDCIHTYLEPVDGELTDAHFTTFTECEFEKAGYPRIMGLFEDPANNNNRWYNFAYETMSALSPLGVKYFQTFNEPDDQWIRWYEGKTLALDLEGLEMDPPSNPATPVPTPTPPAPWQDLRDDGKGYFIDDYIRMIELTLQAAAEVSPDISVILGAQQSAYRLELPDQTLPRDKATPRK